MRAQLHLGLTEPTAAGFRPTANRPGGWHKPLRGLWTSTYDPRFGSGWVQWCLNENFAVPTDGWLGWVLTPAPAARVLTIDSHRDLEQVCARYAAASCRGLCSLDWEAIVRDVDGVRLTDRGQWTTRLSHPHSLYGWDCESTVWLRWAFTSVKALGRRMWSLRDAEALTA